MIVACEEACSPGETTEIVMLNEERVVPKVRGEQKKDASYLDIGVVY